MLWISRSTRSFWANDDKNMYSLYVYPWWGTYTVLRYQSNKCSNQFRSRQPTRSIRGQDTTNEISMVLKGNKATLVINGNEGQRIHWPRASRRELFRLPHLFSERRSRSLDCHPKKHSGSRGRGTIAHRIAGAPTTEADIATQFARYGGSPVLRPILVDHGPDRECCADCAAAQAHQCPALGMEVHGSLGGSAAPFCKSSIDCLSGERTNAIMPSRGGRLMVTPAFISISQVA